MAAHEAAREGCPPLPLSSLPGAISSPPRPGVCVSRPSGSAVLPPRHRAELAPSARCLAEPATLFAAYRLTEGFILLSLAW